MNVTAISSAYSCVSNRNNAILPQKNTQPKPEISFKSIETTIIKDGNKTITKILDTISRDWKQIVEEGNTTITTSGDGSGMHFEEIISTIKTIINGKNKTITQIDNVMNRTHYIDRTQDFDEFIKNTYIDVKQKVFYGKKLISDTSERINEQTSYD